MQADEKKQPVFIIGAGRSGTNMLRDILTSLPSYITWDCDEINPIWRHGHLDHPNDELPVAEITEGKRLFMKKQFERVEGSPHQTIIEKTCANSLRVDYVQALFPNAKFVVIIRDGRDVASSAAKRWVAPLELKYTLKKLRYVPIVDLAYYAMRFGSNRLKQLRTNQKKLSFWGPIYDGMAEDMQRYSLMEICALQWKACVEKTLQDASKIPAGQLYTVKYEDFVSHPEEELGKILDFLGHDSLPKKQLSSMTAHVTPAKIGNGGRAAIGSEQEKAYALILSLLEQLGYEV